MFKFATLYKFWANIFAVACLASAVPTLAYAQFLQIMPEFEVGDRWTFKQQNKGDRKEPFLLVRQAFKSETGSGWTYIETKNPDATRKQTISRFDYKRGDFKEVFAFDSSKPDFKGSRISNLQPFDDVFQLPLSVGKKYTVKWTWNNGQGFDEYNAEVEAFGKVKTDAGEFDAYRIKMGGFWNRTVPDQNGWTGSGRAGQTYWYAPDIKQVVKLESFNRNSNGSPWNEFVSELVKWEPKAPLDPALKATTSGAVAPMPTAAASQ